ncbi:MAG TPA: hypothetical protein VG777_01600, partial [Thermoanaerobaculia bacterium]|nr:hypothetical protein [Thermoanaerobaculia bacterium]
MGARLGRIAIVVGAVLFGAGAAAPPSVADRVAEARRTVEAIRGRAFRRPVPSESVGPERLRTLLAEKLAEGLVVPPEDYFRSLAAIGAISESDLPGLLGRLLDFYGGEVLAFYDPVAGEFFVSTSGTEKLGGFGGMEETLVFTHELTHALQDQYLSLDRRLKALKSNGDAALAIDALLEGEATEVMIESAVKDLPGGDEGVEAMLAPLLTSSLSDIDPDAAKVPSFFSEQLLFPYSEGTAFVRAKKKSGGWKAIDATWQSPPSSSAEILHAGSPPPFPGAALLADGAVDPPPGGSFLYSDTLGEWTLRFLFRKGNVADAEAAAAAWRGDRFLFFRSGSRVAYAGRIRAADVPSARRILEAWKKSSPPAAGFADGADVTVWSGYERAPFSAG